MSEKQELIRKLLDLQKKFIEYEQGHDLDPAEFFAPPPGHPLEQYRKEYDQLASRLVDLAHEEKGSHR